MTDKVQKIREEVKKLHGNPYYMMAVNDFLKILDMQEEPISEDLEEAAEQYAKDYLFTAAPTRSLTDHFKAGAEWQKQQTIDKAAEWLSELDDAKKEELTQKYVDYTFKRHNIDANSKEGLLIYYAFMHGMNKCLTQLRVQKGE